jgi:acyl-CoA reductase-like NAD-dependent aldehyde dehydrogenase
MLSNATKGTNTMKSITKSGLKMKAGVKAGGITLNHNRALRVKAGIKAGGITLNHNRALRVKAGIKAGGITLNHNRALRVKAGIKAGGITLNHNTKGLRVRTSLKAGMKFQANHNRRAIDLS